MHSIKGSFYALIIFISSAILIPSFGPVEDVQLILTITTFLFAILVGFFISRLNTRFNMVRELIAAEDANFLVFYKNSTFFGEKFQQEIADLIDDYYIVEFDSDLGAYKANSEQFFILYDKMHEEKKLSEHEDQVFDDMINLLTSIEMARNKASVVHREKLTVGQWLILILLSGIIVFCLFYVDFSESFFRIIAVLLSTAMVLILLTLRDLQNLRIGSQLIATETGEEIFDFIGKPRYYNKHFLDDGSIKVPNHVKEYRLGLHKSGEKLNIKLVQNNQFKAPK